MSFILFSFIIIINIIILLPFTYCILLVPSCAYYMTIQFNDYTVWKNKLLPL